MLGELTEMWGTRLLASQTTLILHLGLFISNIYCMDETPTQALASISSPTASASGTQHFIHPAKNDVLALGSTFQIRWTPITYYKNVTIQLWDNTSHGFAHDLLTPCSLWARKSCGSIAMHAPNTGAFDWTIPAPVNGTNSAGHAFPRGEQVFYLKMFVEDFMQSAIGNKAPVLSYSQSFAFAKEGESATTVAVDVSSLMVPGGLPLETVAVTNPALGGSSTDPLETTGTSTAAHAETATATIAKKPPMKNSASVVPVVDSGLRDLLLGFGVHLLLLLI